MDEAKLVEEVEDVGFDAEVAHGQDNSKRKLILHMSTALPGKTEEFVKEDLFLVEGVHKIRFAASDRGGVSVEVVFDYRCPGPRSIAQALCTSIKSNGFKVHLAVGRGTLAASVDVILVEVIDGGAGDLEARKKDVYFRRERELAK